MLFSRIALLAVGVGTVAAYLLFRPTPARVDSAVSTTLDSLSSILPSPALDPLSIMALRSRTYDAAAPTIEKILRDNESYTSYLVSYLSDRLKIYAVMAVPHGQVGEKYPIVMLNHGYIPPSEYDNTTKYVAYVDTLARSGFLVFMTDYRGHGSSGGQAEGGYFSPGYTIDVLNGIHSVRQYPAADPTRLFLWGHSMGASVTMRVRAVDPDIRATAIWAGVAGSYEMIMRDFFSRGQPDLSRRDRVRTFSSRQRILERYGSPSAHTPYWVSIDPMTYVAESQTPVQIHHGEADGTVPVIVGKNFAAELEVAQVPHEIFLYPSEDHNINGPSFGVAMQRVVDFYKANL